MGDDASVTNCYAMPETAAACRALLCAVELARHWTDHGPDEQAAAWLSNSHRPVDLTDDQWTMLRICQGIWTDTGWPSFGDVMHMKDSRLVRVGVACITFAAGAPFLLDI